VKKIPHKIAKLHRHKRKSEREEDFKTRKSCI